ncbi:MAG: class I SAM-dependent methyltransferase [Rhodothermales bacterium]
MSYQDNSLRPSWDRSSTYVNAGHRAIFDQTKHLPGWQAEGDSYKLYEMGFYAGDIILEIGTYAGRSAVVELRGTLSKNDRIPRPQFFGIDLNPAAIKRTHNILQQEGLADYALLYYGTLQDFAKHFDIRPTMVFVDGDHRYDGVHKDLITLSEILEPGIPVLCHDYTNPENDTGDLGVRRAVTEWEQAGFAEFMGVFGCSVLLVTSEKCRGKGRAWTAEVFAQRREGLLKDYGLL